METAWNRLELERPPNTRWSSQVFDAKLFLGTLDKIINDLDSQNVLHVEAAVLSRLIYRMKCKFRNDKGLKSMCKVNRALLNYLALSLDKEYKNLKSFVEVDEKSVALPSRQMVQYVLVRTQGFAKLMSRIEEVARCSAHFFKGRINVGHAWTISIVAYSVVSRIWILSKHLVKKSCSWYNGLYPYCKLFKLVGVNWLPKDYALPENLKSWLELSWIEEEVPNVPANIELQNTMFKLIAPSQSESDDDLPLNYQKETIEFDRVNKRESVSDVLPKIENDGLIRSDDIGEIISRNTFDKREKDEKTMEQRQLMTIHKSSNSKKKSLPHELLTFATVTNKSDLTRLLAKESYPGLDKLRWNMVRNKSRKILKELEACRDKKKQSLLFKRAVQRIRSWI